MAYDKVRDMSRREINRLKNKVRLWCVLHGVKMGIRYIDIDIDMKKQDFVYEEACAVCNTKNGNTCPGSQKLKENKPLLILDAKRMVLYRNVSAEKINKYAHKNKYLWCVEWVNHV